MTSPNQSPAPRVDVERHRRALLAAAAVELSRKPDSSMAEIAQAANLARATLYRHFSNRQVLLEAIQAEALARADEALAACRVEDGNALEALERVVASLSREGERFRVLLVQAPGHDAHFLSRREQILSPLVGVVRRGQSEGHIRADLSPEWIVTALTSLLVAAVRGGQGGGNSDVGIADLVFRTLAGGISTGHRSRSIKTR